MQIIQVVHGGTLAFLQFSLAIRLNELVDAHEAAAHTHYKSVVHDLRENLARTEHIEAGAQSRNWQVHPHLIDVFLEHFVDSIASNRSVIPLFLFLHVELLSVDIGLMDSCRQHPNVILPLFQVIGH